MFYSDTPRPPLLAPLLAPVLPGGSEDDGRLFRIGSWVTESRLWQTDLPAAQRRQSWPKQRPGEWDRPLTENHSQTNTMFSRLYVAPAKGWKNIPVNAAPTYFPGVWSNVLVCPCAGVCSCGGLCVWLCPGCGVTQTFTTPCWRRPARTETPVWPSVWSSWAPTSTVKPRQSLSSTRSDFSPWWRWLTRLTDIIYT